VTDRPTVLLVGSAGPDEGRGHVARLVTLAEVIGKHAAVFLELIRGSPTAIERDRLAGAGVRPDRGVSPDAVVIDLPQPDGVAGRWASERLVVFDDSHRLTNPVAVVVQPSLPAWAGRATVETVLAGYAYAPIRPSLRRLAAEPRAPEQRSNVLVCFGGADPDDVTARLAPTIAALLGSTAAVTVVIGASYNGAIADVPGVDVLRDPSDLDERLARATVAVLGAGTMKFEAAHLGIPAVLVAASDDQLAVGPPFAATGAAWYIGDGRLLDATDVGHEVDALVTDAARRERMRVAGQAAVDGRGAERIAREVLALAGSA
jgi:spore coat polysaccharide biosynthesis predicted glycosyltransferase SpsG